MFRRFVLVASSMSVVALLALANPVGAASANMVTGTVTGGFVGQGSVSYSAVPLSDGSTSNATLFFTNGNVVSGSFFQVGGMDVLATKGAVHKGSVTVTGSESTSGTRATITISSAAINPASVATTTGQTTYTGTVQIRVW